MSQTQSSDSLREWSETAKYWAKHSATIRQMFAPLTEALIEGTGIREGHSVLDVAGGAGEPSLTIAERIRPSGSVTCTDAVAEMIEAARADAKPRGITNINFRQCTADSLPFADDLFDAAVSRLGAMFFPDPLKALKEMLRVTKPGGMLAFVVWHKSELNPFCHIVTDVLARHVPAPPADPDAPGAFRFAERGKLAAILTEAGASNVAERVLSFEVQAPISVEQFWTMRSQTSDTFRTKLASLSEAEKTQVAREVQQLVLPFFPNDQMSFPAQMLVVTGRKRL